MESKFPESDHAPVVARFLLPGEWVWKYAAAASKNQLQRAKSDFGALLESYLVTSFTA